MKGNRKLLVTCLLSAMALVSFVGCDQPSTSTSSTSSVSLESVKTTAVTTLTEKVASIDKNAYTDEDLETLFDLQTYGELFIQNATSPETVADNLNVVMGQIEKFESETQKLASGVYSFVASSYELTTTSQSEIKIEVLLSIPSALSPAVETSILPPVIVIFPSAFTPFEEEW